MMLWYVSLKQGGTGFLVVDMHVIVISGMDWTLTRMLLVVASRRTVVALCNDLIGC